MRVRRIYIIDDIFTRDGCESQLRDFKNEFLGKLDVELDGYAFETSADMVTQVQTAVDSAITGQYDLVILDVYFGSVGSRKSRLGLDVALPRLHARGIPVIVLSSVKEFEATVDNIQEVQAYGTCYLSSTQLHLLPNCIARLVRPEREQSAAFDFGFRFREEEEITKRKKAEAAFDQLMRKKGSRLLELPLCAPVSNFLGSPPLPLSEKNGDKLFKAVSTDGTALAVRYEGTALTAKWVANEIRLAGNFSSIRHHYFQEMVRIEHTAELDQKHFRSFYQAGLECFASTRRSHLENIIAVVESTVAWLQSLSLEPTLRLSHVSLLPVVLDRSGIDRFGRRKVIAVLEKETDPVAIRDLLRALEVPDREREVLLDLAHLRGADLLSGIEVMGQHADYYPDALREIKEFAAEVNARQLSTHCRLDPGIYRSLDFYSGLTMQGDIPGMDECLGGGDFTGLVEHFGVLGPVYSFGMACGVERLLAHIS